MSDRLQGKAIIVAGAGSVGSEIGNGRAAAILLAREGARLLLADRDLSAARTTERIIAEEGGEAESIDCDVANSSECSKMVESCLARFGRIDALLNNVGIEIPGGVDDLSEEAWDRTMAVNLKSVFLTSKYVVPHMAAAGSGSIINISSINAKVCLPARSAAYSASKAGVIALTREIAVQFAARGVRANAILPGLMNTPMAAASVGEAYGGNLDDIKRARDALCPSGHQGDAWDTAAAAVFLASDESKYINGTTLVVDGGVTCTLGLSQDSQIAPALAV